MMDDNDITFGAFIVLGLIIVLLAGGECQRRDNQHQENMKLIERMHAP
jgi:hypothetical protein